MPENREPSGGRRRKSEGRDQSGRFKPGASGNPGGRPKDANGIRELARESAPAAVARLKELVGSKDERVAIAASVALLDRGYGKPTQPLEHGGDGPVRPVLNVTIARD